MIFGEIGDAGLVVGITGLVAGIGTAVVTILNTRHHNKLESDTSALTAWKDYSSRQQKHIEEQDNVIEKMFSIQLKHTEVIATYYAVLERFADWAEGAKAALEARGVTLPPPPRVPSKPEGKAREEAETMARTSAQVGELLRARPPSSEARVPSAPPTPGKPG